MAGIIEEVGKAGEKPRGGSGGYWSVTNNNRGGLLLCDHENLKKVTICGEFGSGVRGTIPTKALRLLHNPKSNSLSLPRFGSSISRLPIITSKVFNRYSSVNGNQSQGCLTNIEIRTYCRPRFCLHTSELKSSYKR